jgi:hypothetical protein
MFKSWKQPLAEMQGKAAYMRPKVVTPFPGPGASGSYVYWATLFILFECFCTCPYIYYLFLQVDSLLGRREDSGEHEAMRKMKNEFMINWDGLRTKEQEHVLVLGATNRPFDIDEAVIRRFPHRWVLAAPHPFQHTNRAACKQVWFCSITLGTDSY